MHICAATYQYSFVWIVPCTCFPICLHVCVALCVSATVLFVSCSRGLTELCGVDAGGWMLVVWNPLGLFGRWWSEVWAAHLPLLAALSHPVIRVTVRSCLAPIGRANNSFNNPGPCNISLLFGPRCHAKSPVMEKQLHCRKDGMTGWTLSGNVCVCVFAASMLLYTADWPWYKFYSAFQHRLVCVSLF